MNNEELNKAIEEAAKNYLMIVGSHERPDITAHDYAEGMLHALTTESIYSKARLRKMEEWISVDTPPNKLEKAWLLFKDNSVGEGVFYEGHFGDISAPYFAFYYQPIKWMKQVPPAPPLNK